VGEHKRQALAAAEATGWHPAVSAGAPPRWDGHVVVGNPTLGWFYGELPAQWLSARGIHVDVCKLYERYELAGDRMDFGVRQHLTQAAPLLVDVKATPVATVGPLAARRSGRRLLLALAADPWDEVAWRPQWSGNPSARARFESWLGEADGMLVPSARLADRVRPFTREVCVIPLTLPRREDWPAPRAPRQDSGLRIGWVGAGSHLRDLDCIGPAVLECLARWPSVTFVLGGRCLPSWAAEHPRVEVHSGWWHLPAYYRFVASLDLDAFVCPLEDTPFNGAKPCLKPLEAAMLGLPVVVSRVGSYAEDLEHEETALLVENTTEAWLAALTRLVEDAALRAHLSAGGLAWAATRTIDATGPTWAELWGAA
jgi:glycosyltransferase involved in cell wall biosynthesis